MSAPSATSMPQNGSTSDMKAIDSPKASANTAGASQPGLSRTNASTAWAVSFSDMWSISDWLTGWRPAEHKRRQQGRTGWPQTSIARPRRSALAAAASELVAELARHLRGEHRAARDLGRREPGAGALQRTRGAVRLAAAMGQLLAGEVPLLRLEREEAHARGVGGRRRRLPDPRAI